MFPQIEIPPLRPDAPPLVLPDRPDDQDCPQNDIRPLRQDAPPLVLPDNAPSQAEGTVQTS